MKTSKTRVKPATKRQARQRFPLESLHLDPSQQAPLYRQLEEQLRQLIWQGVLKAGEPLPSTRSLSSLLNIARNTVIKAYEQLAVEGFIQARPGAGYRIGKGLPTRAPRQTKTIPSTTIDLSAKLSHRIATLDKAGNFIGSQRHNPPPLPFRAHIPAFSEFPEKVWTRLYSRRLKHGSRFWQQAVHPCGYWPLRQAIADYLVMARGMRVVPEQVVVSAGVQQCFELLAKVFIDPGDPVLFEEPAYTPAATVFAMAGAKTRFVEVDAEGLRVDKLPVEGAKLIYTTPASHFPLGMSQSPSRRKALLAWAAQSSTLILEDDYNGEYRYRGRPLTTLHSMAAPGQVIYMGSFSKLLFPALRLGYMVVPETIIEPITNARWLLDRHSPPLEQAVLTDFINDGHLLRHLRRMRSLYALRQDSLLSTLEQHLGELLEATPLNGGLHLIAKLHAEVNPEQFFSTARAANITLSSVAQFSHQATKLAQRQVIFGYAPYSEEQMQLAAQALMRRYRKP